MINLNEVCSGFNYVGSSIKKCEIENTIVSLGDGAQYQLSLDVKCSDITVNDETNMKYATLLVDLKCDVTVSEKPDLYTSILLQTEGMFSANKELADDQFEKMMMVNGTSALYGIVRSKLEVISATMYHVGKISLPMINVLELLKEMNPPTETKN